MKTLYLLRHADAEIDAKNGDHSRMLSDGGRKEAARVRAFMEQSGIAPEFVLSSTAARTSETARIVTGQPLDGEAGGSWRFEKQLYQAPYKTILDHVRKTDDGVSHLLVVSHNPGITETALILSDGQDESLGYFPTAGLAIFDCDIANWNDLHASAVRLRKFFNP